MFEFGYDAAGRLKKITHGHRNLELESLRLAKFQVCHDGIMRGLVLGRASQGALALIAQEMASSGRTARNLARTGNFKASHDGFACLLHREQS